MSNSSNGKKLPMVKIAPTLVAWFLMAISFFCAGSPARADWRTTSLTVEGVSIYTSSYAYNATVSISPAPHVELVSTGYHNASAYTEISWSCPGTPGANPEWNFEVSAAASGTRTEVLEWIDRPGVPTSIPHGMTVDESLTWDFTEYAYVYFGNWYVTPAGSGYTSFQSEYGIDNSVVSYTLQGELGVGAGASGDCIDTPWIVASGTASAGATRRWFVE